MFLGLTNSCDDIIRDRAILERERNLNIHLPYYVLSKFFTLSLFAIVQSVLFLLIGDAILEIRGMFWPYLWFMGTTAVAGVAGGLLISSLVNDAKTAANIVPLVLIPQIILGGALIKYDEMNRNLDFIYALTRDRAAKEQQPADDRMKPKDVEVPFVCQFIPMRWSYEAMVVAQAKLNPFTRRQDILTDEIEQLAKNKDLTAAESDRLDDLKETAGHPVRTRRRQPWPGQSENARDRQSYRRRCARSQEIRIGRRPGDGRTAFSEPKNHRHAHRRTNEAKGLYVRSAKRVFRA